MADEKKPEEMKEATPTVEELLAKVKDLESQLGKSKDAVSKASSDASDWKSKYRATLDEAKRKEEEQTEAYNTMQAELTALKTEKRIASYQSKLMASGYDAQTALTMATNLPEGIGEDFFTSQRTFLEAQKQKAKTEALNNQPGLPSGTPPKAASAEEAELAKIVAAAGIKGV